MKRIDTATKAVDLFGAGKHGFKPGNVLAGEAATKLSPDWFNALQEEIARAIEAFGVELDPENLGQLAAILVTFATKADPAFEGVPTAPTAPLGTNTDQIATMAAVKQAIEALVDSAPDALNTLVELAAALGNDANFATTVTNALAGKLSKAGDTMTGALIVALAGLQLTLRNSDNTAASIVEHMRYLRGSGAGVRAAWRSVRGATNAVGDLHLTFLSAADAVLQQYTFGADGKLLLPANPTSPLGAATKQYVDDALAPAQSLTTNGYQVLPGGLILQWGKTAAIADEGSTVVNFPIAFPNACLNASATGDTITVATTTGHHAVTSISPTQMTIRWNANSAVSSSAYWFAIGH